MKILVQWSKAIPQGWEEIDSSEWPSLPAKPEPKGGERLTQRRGWIFAVNIQGVIFYGFDHIALTDIENGGVRAWGWNDDVEDIENPEISTRYRWGVVWNFLPPAFDPEVDAVNTRQEMNHYAEDPEDFSAQANIDVLPWSEYPFPGPEVFVQHGIWLPDDLFYEHHNLQEVVGWREWVN